MDTTSLKAFATAARVQLLGEVSARLGIVLAPSSIARVETISAVNALERAIAAEGGGAIGQQAVIDQVAYMWFNRVIALRFMDVNGYTGIGVVSPEANITNTQPEILTQAKLGQIDTSIFDTKLLARISGLLNGSMRSEDPQNEAYGILLLGYCRHWNKFMPFMFEKEGDFTELLMPANLLSDESVIAKAIKTLSQEVCLDVEVIGWLYQFYIAERKDEVFTGFKSNKKAGPDEIPAATQLFTPDWIVRYLLQNSLGRLWLLNHPDSKIASKMEFYIPSFESEQDFLKVDSPEDLKVMDPASGSGHMLTYAFDLLNEIYEEEGYSPLEIPTIILENNLFGIEIDPRAGALAAFALVMKARAKQRTFFTKGISPNICVLQPIDFTPEELRELLTPHGHRLEEEDYLSQFKDVDTFGSLIIPNSYVTTELEEHINSIDTSTLQGTNLHDRAKKVIQQVEYLSPRYNIVVANPPYMGSKNMSDKMSEFAAQRFPDSKSDLFAMFIERNLDLVLPRGYVAMITMQSWMFLSSYQSLRASILAENFLAEMAHLGTNAFDSIGGDVVSTTAFIIQKSKHPELKGTYIRLTTGTSEAEKVTLFLETLSTLPSQNIFYQKSTDIRNIPGAPVAYWLSDSMMKVFSKGKPLGQVASPKVGLQTGENAEFLRQWFEVGLESIGFEMTSREEALQSNQKWFPYNKGGGFKRWYGNQDYVVNWESDGSEIRSFGSDTGKIRSVVRNPNFYFKTSASWSKVSSGMPAFRFYPDGFIFDVAGTSIFTESRVDQLFLLAYCNSTVVLEILKALAPTLNFEVGVIAELPVIESRSERCIEIADELIAIFKNDFDEDELSWNFKVSVLIKDSEESIEAVIGKRLDLDKYQVDRALELEQENSRLFIELLDLEKEDFPAVESSSISLRANPEFQFGVSKSENEYRTLSVQSLVTNLISYAVGCMFGRYSLDKPGLILANENATLKDYFDKVNEPTFIPDKDNVIPLIDGDWFDDDIVMLFRQFLKVAFGERDFQENLHFIEESLGKDIRKYFVADFYKDHVQRYKKRPIYWLFSSKNGAFNALIYMHRYNGSTASVVLNEYLREYGAKLKAELINQEKVAISSTNARERLRAEKEVEQIRKVILEVSEYERDILFPLATQKLVIDLGDGVKENYAKFGSALKNIPGLGASNE